MNTITLSHIRNTRLVTFLSLSSILIFSLVFSVGIFAAEPSAIEVKVASNSERTSPRDLNSAQISGSAYVFVNTPKAAYVEFRIDNKLIVTEKKAPYDLGTTEKDNSARAYNFEKLANGVHTLRVTVVYGFFSWKNVDVKFTKVSLKTPPDITEPVAPIVTVPTTPVTQPPATTQTTKPQQTHQTKTAREWVIYASSQETPNVELYMSKLDGTQKTRMTNDPRYSNAWPRVTPDGKTIFFYRVPPNTLTSNYFAYSMWRMNIDGTGLTEIFPQGYNGWWLQGHVDISPDGRMLVFAAQVPFKGIVMYTSDLNGQNLKEIPSKTTSLVDPSWTPDGRILFTAVPAGAENVGSSYEVYVTTVQGKGEQRLTFDNFRDHDPIMSPDGKKIAFLTHSDPNYQYPGKWTQRIMNSDDSQVRTLIGPDHFSANPYWIDNETTIYGYWDWEKVGWGLKISRIDGSKTDIFVPAQGPKGLFVTADVQDPFAFNR